MIKNATFHSKAKYIDVQFNWIKDVLENGLMKINKIHTSQSPFDMMTNIVPKEKHELCRALEGMNFM